jgi:hypothetical protein
MTRMLGVFIANLVVVALLSANAIVTLVTGCSLGGTCGAPLGPFTWALAVVPGLLLLIGTLLVRRSQGKAPPAPAATPDVAAADAAEPVAEPTLSDVDSAARDRLSRLVTANRPASVDIADFPLDQGQVDDQLHDIAGPTAAAGKAGDGEQAPDDEPVACDLGANAQSAHLVTVDEPAALAMPHRRASDDWMWLIDPARPQHLASTAVTGFPWAAAAIDHLVSAIAADPHFADDAHALAEAAAWLEVTASLPCALEIEPVDGQSFVDWANSHVGDKGHFLYPLLSRAMADLRAEAEIDQDLAASIPARLLGTDDGGADPLALAS